MTQREMIAEYIDRFGSITPMEAFADLGITKLATRISEMKRIGYKFKTDIVYNVNRYDKVCHYAKYSWEDANND